jgi:hypothetical protein
MDILKSLALLTYYQSSALHDDDPFALTRSRLFDLSGSGELRLIVEPIDAYVAAAVIPALQATIGDSPFVAIETGGWAAPLGEVEDSDLPPSEQPSRRRVRVVLVSDRSGNVASAIGFSDDPESVICDCEVGEGRLLDAFRSAMKQLDASHKNRASN